MAIDAPVDGSLTNTEAVTISIFNYGLNDASNFDVTYQIDGGPLVTETYTGTIVSMQRLNLHLLLQPIFQRLAKHTVSLALLQ